MMRGWSRDSVWMRADSRPVKMPAYLKNARKARFVTTEPMLRRGPVVAFLTEQDALHGERVEDAGNG